MKSPDVPTRSAMEVIPWEGEVRPGVLRTKRDDLVMVFEYVGTDVDGLLQDHIDGMANQLENALVFLDQRVTVWCGAVRRRSYDYPKGDFTDTFAAQLDGMWKNVVADGNQFSNRHFIAFTLTSQHLSGSIFDRMGAAMSAGAGPLAALKRSIEMSFNETALLTALERDLDSDAERLSEVAATVLGSLPYIKAQALQGSALRSVLKTLVSPASPEQEVKESRLGLMYDAHLADNIIDLASHPKLMRFAGVGEERFASAIGLVDWPDSTIPGLLDGLTALPIEITITQTFKSVDQAKAERYIKAVRQYNQQRKVGIMDVMRAKINRMEVSSDDHDHGRSHNINQVNEALASLRSERRLYGHYNMTIIVYGRTPDEAREAVRMARDLIQAAHFVARTEEEGMLTAFKSTLPGMHHDIIRWHWAHAGHLADLAFIRTIAQGERKCSYFEEQLQKPAPALMTLPTEYATPYWYNLLQGQVGHTLIIGPTGAGKTVFTNFMAAQFHRYGEVNIFRFDMDYSCYIPTILNNGRHIDLTSGDVKLNPFKLAAHPAHRPWLTNFVRSLITAHGYEWSAEDAKRVAAAIESLPKLRPTELHIESLADCLPTEDLRRELEPWLPDGPLGHLFGNDEDNFEMSNNTCIEMGGMLKDPIAAPRLIDYFTYRIRQKISSGNLVPTLIDIQEAWYFLQDPLFKREIETWLKTMRKLLGTVILSTQSIQDASSTDVFAAIGDNIPTRIFLPNVQARTDKWRQVYSESLGLNDAQIDRIANAVPFRDYYLVRGQLSRMLKFAAPPAVLAGLRSDRRARQLLQSMLPESQSEREKWEWKADFLNNLVKSS